MRIDKWLFAVRVFASRTQATEACSVGRVTIGGNEVKPSSAVAVGDSVEVRKRDRTLILEVVDVIDKRVSPALAASCFIDRSPQQEQPDPLGPRRERGSGRPTKKDRRQMERLTRPGGTSAGEK